MRIHECPKPVRIFPHITDGTFVQIKCIVVSTIICPFCETEQWLATRIYLNNVAI